MQHDIMFKLFEDKLSKPLLLFHSLITKSREIHRKKSIDFNLIDISGQIDIHGASEMRDVLAHLYSVLCLDSDGEEYQLKLEIETELMFEHIRRGSVETIQNCVRDYYSYLLYIFISDVRPKKIATHISFNKYSLICAYIIYIKDILAQARRIKANRKEWLKSIELFLKALDSCNRLKTLIDKYKTFQET